MIYFLSDPHFGHEASIQLCRRPFANVQEMNEQLIKNWNSRIRPEDAVYVLGDLTLMPFKEFEPIAARLQGRKILVKGNHDHFSNTQYNRLGFDVCLELKLKLLGRICRLSHYPYALPWYKLPFAFKSEKRFMEHRPPRIEGEVLIHGHTHTRKTITAPGMIHVGVDAHKFYPISLNEMEPLLRKVD